MPAFHFSVHGDLLTRHIRDLWHEGRYSLALDTLESSNCPRQFWDDIIMGKLQMSGVNELTLAPDDWTPPHASYPDPSELARMAESSQMYKSLYFGEINPEYDRLARRWRVATTGAEISDLADQLVAIPWEFAESLTPHERGPWLEARNFASMGLIPGHVRQAEEVTAFVKKQLDLDKKPMPEPDRAYESEYGWILPDGSMYPCGHMEHIWLAEMILPLEENASHEAEDRGWIKITRSLISKSSYAILRSERAPAMPQPQLDGLWEWCQNHGEELPAWAKE